MKYADNKLNEAMDHERNIECIWHEVVIDTCDNLVSEDYELIEWVKNNTTGMYWAEIENAYVFYLFE